MREFLVRRTLDQWIIVDATDENHAIEVASAIGDDDWATSDETYEPEQHPPGSSTARLGGAHAHDTPPPTGFASPRDREGER